MKRAMVYIVALTLAFSVLLSGCGENLGSRREPTSTKQPQNSAAPATMMPDPDDGVVKDEDGIITDDDSGNGTDSTIPSGTNDMENGDRSSSASSSGRNDGAATGSAGIA